MTTPNTGGTANDKVLAYIRTYVPYAIGAALAWLLAVVHLDLTGEFQLVAVTFAVALTTNVYYWLIRVLEVRFPWIGVFLGFPKQPEYARVDNLWASLIRTAIPTLAAAAVAAASSLIASWADAPITIDSAGLAVILVAVFEAIYYAIAKEITTRFPSASWLLGTPAQPTYTTAG